MGIAPCVNCPSIGCGSYHDVCPAFKKYKEGVKQERAVINRQKEINNLCRTKPVKRRKTAKM